jgi:hypothetical protein
VVPETSTGEAFDQWFDSFQQFEATLEAMAAASTDLKFREEMAAIEQWFKVLSEAERTASLYTLLQNSTQSQIKFFIAILQQMANAVPATAGVTPATGTFFQNQVNSKLDRLNSPLDRLGSPVSAFAGRGFNLPATSAPANGSRKFLLSPNSPAFVPCGLSDSANTLAQQRAKLRAGLQSARLPGSQLSQILERTMPNTPDSALSTPYTADSTSTSGESSLSSASTAVDWSSMVNTPASTMFPKKQYEPEIVDHSTPWGADNFVPRIGDASIYRKTKGGAGGKANWRNTAGKENDAKDVPSVNAHVVGLGIAGFNAGVGGAPTPAGVVPDTAYNQNVMEAMGLSPEAQMLAVQMYVNNFGTNGQLGAQPARGGWRGLKAGPKSAGLKSSAAPKSGKSAALSSASTDGLNSAGEPKEAKVHEVDPELLKDVPAWLKSLRLHKYAPNFEGMGWQDMVVLDEAALETKGVSALGARRRLVKVFEGVRKHQGMEPDVPAVPEPSAAVEPVIQVIISAPEPAITASVLPIAIAV